MVITFITNVAIYIIRCVVSVTSTFIIIITVITIAVITITLISIITETIIIKDTFVSIIIIDTINLYKMPPSQPPVLHQAAILIILGTQLV